MPSDIEKLWNSNRSRRLQAVTVDVEEPPEKALSFGLRHG
jgi:hypothetical protein